jgi:Fe-S cluster assembly protein SufD
VVVLDGRPVDGFGTEPDSSGARRAVRVRSLSSGWRRDDDGDGGLGRLAAPTSSLVNAFALLNTAFFEDGVLIEAPEHGVSPQPIHLLHVVSATGDPEDDGTVPATYPRVLVRAAKASELTLVETYASLGDQRALVCPVTEIFCDAGAVVRHYRVTREGAGVVHVGSQHVRLERDASVSSLQLSWGGDLVRCDVHALLAGEGGDCVLDGLYVLGGRQHFDTHMRVEHLAPRCDSHELYKGVIDDAAHAVFDGRIYVHRAAQKTDAKQTNRNLLLSDRAVANSNPQLEIFADDVKCTHGSTIGQLEPDALFYLRSRGIDRDAARSLLTYAFASELLGRIGVAALREAAEAVLVRRLAGGAVVEELRPGVTGAGAGA